jgi:excisionase family DNA binding protein
MDKGQQEVWVEQILEGLPPLLDLKETAAVLRCSTRSVRRRVEDGRLRALRTAEGGSGRLLVPKSELKRLLSTMVED